MSQTTPARWSNRLQQLRAVYDRILQNNPLVSALPSLHANDYDFYLRSVLEINPLFKGSIYYKGLEIKKQGDK
jgi:hypothetical protein